MTINTRSKTISEKSSFHVENHAAPLKGEFQRIEFGKAENIDNSNAIVLFDTFLPGDIRNLYIEDQVGNVTTSKAKFKGDTIGKGKKNSLWCHGTFYLEGGSQIGPSILTGKLTRPLNSSVHFNKKLGLFEGKYKLAPLFTSVFSETYELHLCLPENAELVSFEGDIPVISKEEYFDHGILEFFGKSCYKFTFQNVWSALYEENFYFSFKYDT